MKTKKNDYELLNYLKKEGYQITDLDSEHFRMLRPNSGVEIVVERKNLRKLSSVS